MMKLDVHIRYMIFDSFNSNTTIPLAEQERSTFPATLNSPPFTTVLVLHNDLFSDGKILINSKYH